MTTIKNILYYKYCCIAKFFKADILPLQQHCRNLPVLYENCDARLLEKCVSQKFFKFSNRFENHSNIVERYINCKTGAFRSNHPFTVKWRIFRVGQARYEKREHFARTPFPTTLFTNARASEIFRRGDIAAGKRKGELTNFTLHLESLRAEPRRKHCVRTNRTRGSRARESAGFIPLRHFVAILWWDYETQLAAPQCRKYTRRGIPWKTSNPTLLLSLGPLSFTSPATSTRLAGKYKLRGYVFVSRALPRLVYREESIPPGDACDVSAARFDPRDPNLSRTPEDT